MRLFLLPCLMFILAATQAQTPDPFKPGRYYDSEGKRTDGFIAYKPNIKKHVFIFFKANETDEPVKITANKLKGFAMDADTFAVLRNFKAEGAMAAYISISVAIAQVLETGKVILYKYSFYENADNNAQGLAGAVNVPTWASDTFTDRLPVTNYLVQQQGKEAVFAVREAQKEFNQQMADYFKMNKELAEKIRQSTYSNRTTPALVHEFNTWYKQRKATQ